MGSPVKDYPLIDAGPFWHELKALLIRHGVHYLYEPVANAITDQFFGLPQQLSSVDTRVFMQCDLCKWKWEQGKPEQHAGKCERASSSTQGRK